MHKILHPLFALIFLSINAFAQDVDVVHYKYELDVNDNNDTLKGQAIITFIQLSDKPTATFDLAGRNQQGKGMHVTGVSMGNNPAHFIHKGDKLIIDLPKKINGDTVTVWITYQGIPGDGLIISKNKYGDRTFFADNWPNRAHCWIPCKDVPGDKAGVEFTITAPAHYKVVSNGVLVEEKEIVGGKKRTHWKEDQPIPTKVMVFGAARFAVKRLDSLSAVPVTAWVYPQDSAKGFYDYALAVPILQFFSNYIGTYPYKKLANVQSKTVFGGMENASAIFYAESTVTGDRRSEDLLAHEIAHQWFGNTATEKSFPHLWLSEGFATYLTDIYIEHKYGKDSMMRRLQEEREKVIQFAALSNNAIVDTATALMDLLNANSYQKGAWVLHMLRSEVGDSLFHQIIKTYYQQYKGSNANTRDFEKVAETVSGKDWKLFFDQWLYTPGLPVLKLFWNPEGGTVEVQQLQGTGFVFPLEVAFKTQDGKRIIQRLLIKSKTEKFKMDGAATLNTVTLDPNTQLLFKASVINVYNAKMPVR